MNGINWDGFRYFVAAAETGSLSAAAKVLDSNQPTVGRYIDTLESELGLKLFQRHAKGLTLTQEGAYILDQSLSMRSLVLKSQRSVQGSEQEVSGTVKIAVPEGLCHEVLLTGLPNFYDQYPGICLVLNVSTTTASLTSGDADVAIRLFRPDDANLVVKHLGDMPMGLYASSGYCKVNKMPENTDELKSHRIIAYGGGLAGLSENQWLAKHSSPSHCVLRSDSTVTRLKATLMGVGISIQPHIFSTTNNSLCRLIEAAQIPGHKIWLVYHNDLRDTGRVRAVVDFVSSGIESALSRE
ncbi:Transcriptional regulator, LysR family [hydrothermal vent metagenome]|uniref:Transcriptional regulator, LysR family n=1 Tax=hydrothermal vent metagenome TaxID=652676 RepID=A0A3B0YU98_9ZZZZ